MPGESPFLVDDCLLMRSSHVEEKKEISWASFVRTLIPFLSGLPIWLISSQRFHLVIPSLWGLGFQHKNFGGMQTCCRLLLAVCECEAIGVTIFSNIGPFLQKLLLKEANSMAVKLKWIWIQNSVPPQDNDFFQQEDEGRRKWTMSGPYYVAGSVPIYFLYIISPLFPFKL